MHNLLHIWFSWVENWGYLGVFLLMALESSIVPVPSEVVMPPAAYLAAQGKLDMTGVILAGTVGSYVGSAVSYWVSKWVGLPFVHRFGKYVFLKPAKIDAAHKWVERFGAGGIFFARLLPVVRHLVSIPAGILSMPFARFSAATTIGAGLWCTILSLYGAKVITPELMAANDPEALVKAVKAKLGMIVLGIIGLAVAYALMVFLKNRAAASNEPKVPETEA
jgi:membrane protein DedA with SNARE-associated domain